MTETPGNGKAADRAGLRLRCEVEPKDVEAVRHLVAATGFFSEAEVAVAVELVEERLARGDASGYRFVLAERQGALAGYTAYGSIAVTNGSFDLYWIAVSPSDQGRGLGRFLLRETERRIAEDGGRLVWVETSSRKQYAPTRAFYERSGYHLEATLRDFYAPGDHKCVYVREAAANR